MKLKLFILDLALILMLAGCATTPPPLTGRPDLLGFLADGKTAREEVIITLGQPSGRFENDRIFTYRLGYAPKNGAYYVVEREALPSGWPTWKAAQSNLVLVFDGAGVLNQHSLVKVNK